MMKNKLYVKVKNKIIQWKNYFLNMVFDDAKKSAVELLVIVDGRSCDWSRLYWRKTYKNELGGRITRQYDVSQTNYDT